MAAQGFCTLFKDYQSVVRNIQKIFSANSHLSTSKGTRKMQKARKYRRPEDLADPHYYGIGPRNEVKSAMDSLATRGFAKELPPYKPPEDVDDQLHKICKKVFGSELSTSWKEHPLNEPLLKFKVLTKCMDTFKKNIPSSYLHQMKTVEDLLTFYSTPIDGCLHYDALLRDSEKLPPNLHVMQDRPSFNPSTDTFFDGITAFPGRKRIVYTKTGEKFEKVIEWPNI